MKTPVVSPMVSTIRVLGGDSACTGVFLPINLKRTEHTIFNNKGVHMERCK